MKREPKDNVVCYSFWRGHTALLIWAAAGSTATFIVQLLQIRKG